MSGTNIIRAMAEYHVASNRRLRQEALQSVTDEQFVQPLGYSHGSLRQQVVHLAQTDRYWLHDIQTKPVLGLNAEDYPTLASFTPLWEGIEQAVLDYVRGLSEHDLAAVPAGLLETRWEALVHMFTHGTDHRAQILSMLHGLGAPTFEQDFGDHRRRRRRVGQTEVLKLIRFRRGEWDGLAAAVPAARMEEMTPGGWSVKDTLAHIAWYDRVMLDTLRERQITRAVEWRLPRDERNQLVYEQQHALPLAAVLEQAASTHQELLAALATLDDDDLNDPSRVAGLPAGTTLWMLLETNTWLHYLEHTEALWEWLGVAKKA